MDKLEDWFEEAFPENSKYINEESKLTESDHFVAIKKTKMRRTDYLKHSFNFSTYREIMHLQELDHENIIKLKDVFYKDK